MNDKTWYIYIIRTSKGHLYTGISTDVDRRFNEHTAGKGAKYLRGKGPLTLVFKQFVGDHAKALKLEAAIKKLPRAGKNHIVQTKRLPSFHCIKQSSTKRS